MKYNEQTYKQMINMNLDTKIAITQERLRDEITNTDAYVSFSGGKDSTVLLTLARDVCSWVPAVYDDTPMEFPELRKFAMDQKNIIRIRPKISIKEVFERYGYPVISKSQAMAIRKLTTQNLSEKYRNKLLYGDSKGTSGKLSNKWHYLLNAPFKISEQCCDVMKKRVFHKFENENNVWYPITAEMATESNNRKIAYMKYGCNGIGRKRPKGTPMGFWTEQDVLEFIYKYKVDIAPVYGEVKQDCFGNYYTTGEKRTGCMFCMFGCHLEKQPNRFQRMYTSHPKQYDYFINKLGLGEVLDYLGVEYRPCGTIKEEQDGQLRIV